VSRQLQRGINRSKQTSVSIPKKKLLAGLYGWRFSGVGENRKFKPGVKGCQAECPRLPLKRRTKKREEAIRNQLKGGTTLVVKLQKSDIRVLSVTVDWSGL